MQLEKKNKDGDAQALRKYLQMRQSEDQDEDEDDNEDDDIFQSPDNSLEARRRGIEYQFETWKTSEKFSFYFRKKSLHHW